MWKEEIVEKWSGVGRSYQTVGEANAKERRPEMSCKIHLTKEHLNPIKECLIYDSCSL